jgi:hypothetical protein
MFRRKISPLSSGFKSKPSKKQTEIGDPLKENDIRYRPVKETVRQTTGG